MSISEFNLNESLTLNATWMWAKIDNFRSLLKLLKFNRFYFFVRRINFTNSAEPQKFGGCETHAYKIRHGGGGGGAGVYM